MFSVVPESKLLFKWGKECQTLESKGKDDRKSLPNRLLCVQATVRCLSGTCAADLNPTTYRLFEREGVTGGTSCTTGYKSSSHLQKIFLFLVQQSKPNTWGEKKKKNTIHSCFPLCFCACSPLELMSARHGREVLILPNWHFSSRCIPRPRLSVRIFP